LNSERGCASTVGASLAPLRRVNVFRAVLLACLAAACSKEPSAAGKNPSTPAKTRDSAAGSVDLGGPAYKPGPMSAVGSLSGVIRLDGAPAIDSTPVKTDERVCEPKPPSGVNATPKGLADVVVWIADAKTGKELPMEKRVALASEKCLLDPRVQAAVSGSTVNVFNDDKSLHRLAFISASTGDTLQKIPFFNDGQVVASEVVAKRAGMVEVRCKQHPWSHAFLAVFDHPYFAVTESDGRFTIDSLPPGQYTVNVWHEGMKQPLTQKVQIAAGGQAKLDTAVKLQ
jgi:hypothetical protein